MDKKQLIRRFASKAGITIKDAREYVDIFKDAFMEGLMEDGFIKLRKFGTFKIQERKYRTWTNPKTRELVKIPGRNLLKFKAHENLLDEINEDAEERE